MDSEPQDYEALYNAVRSANLSLCLKNARIVRQRDAARRARDKARDSLREANADNAAMRKERDEAREDHRLAVADVEHYKAEVRRMHATYKRADAEIVRLRGWKDEYKLELQGSRQAQARINELEAQVKRLRAGLCD